MCFKTLLLSLICLLAFLGQTKAQDFVYTPQNPAFGGNTFNYQWMLSGANAQNTYTDPEAEDRFNRDPLADFEQDLNRQVLSQLSRNLVRNQFGDEGLEDGLYNIGSYQVEVVSQIDGINISILDTGTGDQTNVFVPFF